MQKPLAGLTRKNALREVVAGVTLLAIAVPLNIGYAQIAGLPPAAGLYALVLPTIVYALVVSSRQLVASPDAAAAALVASSIGGLAVAGSADYATLAPAGWRERLRERLFPHHAHGRGPTDAGTRDASAESDPITRSSN